MKNPLKDWYEIFSRKRSRIISENNLKTEESILAFFSYDNLKAFYPDFCPLFGTNETCHKNFPKGEKFNCFYCACPHFDFEYWNEDLKEYGRCKIASALGKYNEYGYWDCTNCFVVHLPKNVLKYLKEEKK